MVRNNARLTNSIFGGACWSPSAWRKIESTVTIKGKHVTIIAIPGAKLRTVIKMVLSQILAIVGLIVVVGHSYPARAANCLNGH